MRLRFILPISMIWYRLYIMGHYNAGLNILAIVPDYHYRLYGTFTDLPPVLGGVRRERRRKGLEEKVYKKS